MTEVIGEPVRLIDGLRRPDTKGRELEDAMMIHLFTFQVRNNLTCADMLRGLLGNVVAACISNATSLSEARAGVQMVCDEMLRRVTAR